MKQTLIDAIRYRRLITLGYHGYSRTVEPHCLGADADGQLKLRCWQVSGGSVSGERQGWKLLNVSDIHAASTTTSQAEFSGARPGYKRDDQAMRHIYAQL